MDIALSLMEIAVICPLIVTVSWSLPLLFSKSGKHESNRWLGLFMLNMFMIFLCTGSFYFGSYKLFIALDPVFMFSQLSVFPLLYFYIHSIAKWPQKFQRKQLIHQLPALGFLIVSSTAYIVMLNGEETEYYVHIYLTGQGKLTAGIRPIEIINRSSKIFFGIQSVVYFFFIKKLIDNYKESITSYHSNLEKLNIRWHKLFYLIFITSVCIGLPALFAGHRSIVSHEITMAISMIVLSIIFFLIAWIGFTQQFEYFNYLNGSEPENIQSTDFRKLKTELLALFEHDKPFLNPDLKIYDLYTLLGTNRTYLSNMINTEFGTNFCMFVNRYRIKEAKKRLLSKDYSLFKTEEIGQQAGFNSYHSFVMAFRLFEHTTPSKYRKSIKA